MKRYYEQALARAEERLQRLETYKETARANSGVIHNPGFLDQRIEKARWHVADLQARADARED